MAIKAVALKTIHILKTAGEVDDKRRIIKPAKVDVVEAGKIVDLSEKQFTEFLADDAVRKATKVDLAAAEDGHVDLEPVPELNLGAKTVEELKALATTKGIQLKSSDSKDDIIKALEAAALL